MTLRLKAFETAIAKSWRGLGPLDAPGDCWITETPRTRIS